MSDYFIELGVQDIKQYASVTRSCVFKDACFIRSKLGRLVLDLSDIENINKCEIFLKRISGNGAVTIEYYNSTNHYKIISKIRETISILEFPKDSKIEIQRPNISRGEIAVFGIKCYLDKPIDVRDKALSTNWKKLIKGCKYGGLRLSKNRLFASHGGFIEDKDLIYRIQTNPSNMYSIKDDRIVFLGSCEIIDLLLSSNVPKNDSALFINRKGPTPEKILKSGTETPQAARTRKSPLFNKTKEDPSQYQELLIYDSATLKHISSSLILSNKKAKTVKSNAAEFVVLSSGGNFYVPMAALEQDMEYVVAITSKKLSGNGRTHMGFTLEKKISEKPLQNISRNEFREQFISISTGIKTAPNQQFYLNISMREDGSGETIISRIRVLQGMKAYHRFENKLPSNVLSDTSVLDNIDIGCPTDDQVFTISKKYCRLVSTNKIKDSVSTIEGAVYSGTLSGVYWINKIRRVFSRINHVKAENLIGEKTVSICNIRKIPRANTIWLEEFDAEALTHQAIEGLQKAKIIHSPSLPNVQLLREFCEPEVVHTPRLLPFVPPKPVPHLQGGNYILSFNRNNNITKRIAESWTNDMPKIVMIGLRGRFPQYIIPINEYLPYSELIFLISRAQCVLDIHGENKDYTSGFLHLASAMNKTIVTNNWFGMDKPNCIFSISDDLSDGELLPSIQNLNKDLKKALQRKNTEINNMNEYNVNLSALLKTLF